MKQRRQALAGAFVALVAIALMNSCASTPGSTTVVVGVGVGVGFGHPIGGYGPGWRYPPGYRPGRPVGPPPSRPRPPRPPRPTPLPR